MVPLYFELAAAPGVNAPLKQVIGILCAAIPLTVHGHVEQPTFFCRLHVGGERSKKLESPLRAGCCSKAELGSDAQAKGILHSTSDAQLSPAVRLQCSKLSPVTMLKTQAILLINQ